LELTDEQDYPVADCMNAIADRMNVVADSNHPIDDRKIKRKNAEKSNRRSQY
jgi:hypothetical protein